MRGRFGASSGSPLDVPTYRALAAASVTTPSLGSPNEALYSFPTPGVEDFTIRRFSLLVPRIQVQGGTGSYPEFPANLLYISGVQRSKLQVYVGGQGALILNSKFPPVTSQLGGALDAVWSVKRIPVSGGAVYTASLDMVTDARLVAPRGTAVVGVAFNLPYALGASSTLALSTPGQAYAFLVTEESS